MAIDHNNFRRNKIHPQKFALWLALGSVTMMFGAFTSAYIVKEAAGNWLDFSLPTIFFYSTGIIILSSVALHFSYRAFVNESFSRYKGLLSLAFLLGVAFMVLQFIGWNDLYNMGIDIKGNPSGSFLYLITWVHAAHVIGGLGAIVVALLHAYTLPNKITELRKHRFQLTYNYWHFMGILWVYLLCFLIFTN